MTFLDTSAVGRLLAVDIGSDEIRDLFRSGRPLFGSTLLLAELLRIATRLGRGFAEAERAIRRIQLLAIDDSLLPRCWPTFSGPGPTSVTSSTSS